MRHHLAIAALLAGVAVLPIGVAAQEATDTGTSATAPELAQADMQFVQEATVGGKAEVELGQMAVDKAETPEVKEFGQMMVDDHGKANDQLTQIVDEKKLETPSEMPSDVQQTQDRLNGLSGAEFDREYIKQMVTDHEKTIELFQTEADSGEDAELKQFAQETLPTLQKHLEQAQQIDTQMSEMAGATGEEMQPAADSPEATEPAAGSTTAEPTDSAEATAEATDDTTAEATDSPEATEPAVGGTTADSADSTATQQAAIPSAFGTMRADELIGKDVTNENGDEVGEIQDIVINTQDKAVLAVISVGGFLGIGDKNVAVPFDQLQQGENETVLLSGTSEDELKQMPAYDESTGAYEDYPRDQPLSSNQ